jgi:MFS transporter, NNP family, nitrate/nitrite transporter
MPVSLPHFFFTTTPAIRAAVTGIVRAASGLGGFFPPLVMRATYGEAELSYNIG